MKKENRIPDEILDAIDGGKLWLKDSAGTVRRCYHCGEGLNRELILNYVSSDNESIDLESGIKIRSGLSLQGIMECGEVLAENLKAEMGLRNYVDFTINLKHGILLK